MLYQENREQTKSDVLICFLIQIENDPQEFALYCVHRSGGRT